MNLKSKLEFASGIVLIFLGILFVYGFGIGFQDLVTDAIFILFGILLIRSARNNSTKHYTPSDSKARQKHASQENDRKRRG